MNISLADIARFQGVTVVGTYDGIAEKGELIMIEASGVSLEGRYVVLQKDNKDLDEAQWQLHVGDFAAFGEYTMKKTGNTHTIQKQWSPFLVSSLKPNETKLPWHYTIYMPKQGC